MERRVDPAFRERWDRAAYARAVANRVIRYRAEHNLTQEQLAQRLGVKQPHVARLESGEHAPSIVEGSGSYGAALARHLRAAGVEVIEVNQPDRAARRREGKTDSKEVT